MNEGFEVVYIILSIVLIILLTILPIYFIKKRLKVRMNSLKITLINLK